MVRERQHLLTKDEITAFSEIGWITKKALFHADEISKMRACFENLERMSANLDATGLHEGSHFVLGSLADEPVIRRVVWAGGSQPYLLEVGEDPRLTQPCAQLLGSNEMEQLLSQAHFKRPGDALFFDPSAAHVSFENTSDSYRRVLINGYAYPGANGRIYPGSNAGRTVSVS
jgi:hypothetical protein